MELVFFSSSKQSLRHMEELQKQQAERESQGKAKEQDEPSLFWFDVIQINSTKSCLLMFTFAVTLTLDMGSSK